MIFQRTENLCQELNNTLIIYDNVNKMAMNNSDEFMY